MTDPGSIRGAMYPLHAAHRTGRRGLRLALGVVLLAWPVWYALRGPASLSGLVWPNVGVIGGFIPSSFVTTGYPPRSNVFLRLGGYEGAPLASSAYLGWSFLVVMVAGLAAFWRDRRLWFFGFALVVCAACSLGERRGQWEPAWIFTRIPVIENVIEQRFMAVGFLAAAVILAVVLERGHAARVPAWRGALGALAVAAVALVPMGIIFGDRLPFAMQAVTLPRWYSEIAPTLPVREGPAVVSRAVLRLQSAMACGRRSTACTTARPVVAGPREWWPGPARRHRGSPCWPPSASRRWPRLPPAPRCSSPRSATRSRSGR